MTLLPIQFYTKIDKRNLKNIEPAEVLDIIEDYFKENHYYFIKRKTNKIIFHKANGWSSINFKSFLVSGVVKVTEKDGMIHIMNGNWMVFLISVPFIFIYLVGHSSKSSFDEGDFEILFFAFLWFFGANLIARILAHWEFKSVIKKKILSSIYLSN